jgi:hypothetical protein
MTEIQNCLPEHARRFFIQARNLRWEASSQAYRAELADSRSTAAARGTLKSGMQMAADWQITHRHMGDRAFEYFEAAVETCTLYDIRLTKQLCTCIEMAIKDFLVAQEKNAIHSAGQRIPGFVEIPLSARQQLSQSAGALPRYNEILIELEKARIQNDRNFAEKSVAASPSANAMTKEQYRESNRPDVLNVLIASPGDVNSERDAVTDAIHEWNAVNAHPDTLNILLHPIRWETHSFPESGDRAQALINRQIVGRGDILIGLFGARIGTPTGIAASGTIEEIEEFRQADKYVALYFSDAPVPRNVDRSQLDALEAYKSARQKDTKHEVFSSVDDLRQQISKHLTGIVRSVAKPLQLGMWRSGTNSAEPIEVQKSVEAIVKEQMEHAQAERRKLEDEKADAARWKPTAHIVSNVEGQEQVNKLRLESSQPFALVDVALISPDGVKLESYPVNGGRVFSTGTTPIITHSSLLKIANNSQSYFQFSSFQGSIRYTVVREKDGVEYTGTLPFHAEMQMVNNTLWFKLTG